MDTPSVRIIDDPAGDHVSETGSVSSVQLAELELPATALENLWKPETLERLARAYWRYLNRVSFGLLRVVYEPDARTVVLLSRPLALLRFRAPQYEARDDLASVTWQIERGLLVAREGRGTGLLRITVRRCEDAGPGVARLALGAEVRNFYPWLRGSGRFARVGVWLYGRTQMRIHVIVTRGFLRSLARLDLPPSQVGLLRGEIDAGVDSRQGKHRSASGAVAGAVAAVGWAAQQPLDKRLFRSSYDDVELLGKFVTRGRFWPVAGLALHLSNGALFGAAYALFEPHLRGPDWARGLIAAQVENFGLWPLVRLTDRFHPARAELPRLSGNTRALWQATWRHALFGTILGIAERRLRESVS